MSVASELYRVEVRRTSRLQRLGKWLLNLTMATTPDATRVLVPWDREAVIFDRTTGKQLRVVRNDSSLSEDAVANVVEDVEEMTPDQFERCWL